MTRNLAGQQPLGEHLILLQAQAEQQAATVALRLAATDSLPAGGVCQLSSLIIMVPRTYTAAGHPTPFT